MKSEKKKILIVEDDDDNYILLEAMLEKLNLNLIHVKDGLESIEVVKRESDILLVIMDIMLPGMDGYKATNHIKKLYPNMPVVAYTAYILPSGYNSELQKVFNDVITKPILNKRNVVELIQKYLT